MDLIVLIPKDDGGIQITLDMRNAIHAISSTNIPIPCVKDIKAQLNSSQYFTELDFKSTLHHIKIDEPSRYLTVFHTGHKLIRYQRLTMGAKPATGELTKALLSILSTILEANVSHKVHRRPSPSP